MIVGEINKLKVKRISDIAYILEDGDNEVFLHKKEALKDYEVGDEVECFIYEDSRKRIAASCRTPLITTTTPAFLRVADVLNGMGIFLDDGMPKDLLLAENDIPFKKEYMPQVGDYLYVFLKTTNDNFRAKLLPKEAFYDYMHPSGILPLHMKVKAYIVMMNDKGIIAFTKDGFEVFIPKFLARGEHRIGEELSIEILKSVDERHYQGSIIEKKELQMPIDSKKIYDYLKINKSMTLTDKSDPIDIYQKFQLSKAAFKRAIGHLYKEKLIEVTDDEIKLKVEQ